MTLRPNIILVSHIESVEGCLALVRVQAAQLLVRLRLPPILSREHEVAVVEVVDVGHLDP